MSRYVTEIQVNGLFFLTSSQCIIRVHRYLISSVPLFGSLHFRRGPATFQPSSCDWPDLGASVVLTAASWRAHDDDSPVPAWEGAASDGWDADSSLCTGFGEVATDTRLPPGGRGDVPMDLVSTAAGVDLGCWPHGSSWSLSSSVLLDIWSCALWGVESLKRTVSDCVQGW